MLKKIIVLFVAFIAAQVLGIAEEPGKEMSAQQAAIDATLKEDPNQIVLVVNGLSCPNCAIGIGKKVCELGFIDTEALPKGVKVNAKVSLLTVAIKKDQTIEIEPLVEAIRKAGYDPVRLYQRTEGDALKVTDIPQDS